VIARYKHTSLFGLVVNNEGKKFYNIGTRWPIIEEKEEEFGDSFKCFLFFAIFLFSRKKKLADLKKKKQFLKIFLHLLVPLSET
jgi:hypothetical protein